MCGAEQMRKLKDLLNQIGDFHFQSGKDKVDFIGTLVNKDNHVIIQARIEKKNLDCCRFVKHIGRRTRKAKAI